MSDIGESCAKTCQKNGQIFSFIVADKDDPVTPQLLGQAPNVKQEPWAALECFVPGEDRYRTASSKAAKLVFGDLGAWKNETCQLACPCGEDEAGVSVQPTSCQWNPPPMCVSEFDYEGTHYFGCTTDDHKTPWCSTSSPYTGSWTNCAYNCTTDTVAPDTDIMVLCTYEADPSCSTAFSYKGVEYTGCSYEDHPTPWCSKDRIHQGLWTKCSKVCRYASNFTTLSTTSSPKVTTSDPVTSVPDTSKPCVRNAQSAEDVVGLSVLLDQTGYSTVVRMNSTANMKTFICRVVDDMGCQVTDSASLAGFVPYHSSVEHHETYQRLEHELSILCHTDGAWVVPA
jgi:hypothetical protein